MLFTQQTPLKTISVLGQNKLEAVEKIVSAVRELQSKEGNEQYTSVITDELGNILEKDAQQFQVYKNSLNSL